MIEVIERTETMREWSRARRAEGHRIGFVPTMGYLHEGHLELVREARRRAGVVLASVFVNPTQFGPNEDFSRYPRDTAGDLKKLLGAGCEAVFMPTPAEIYPPGFDTWVVPGALAEGLCGASRPGHFRGVCTVVHALFRITACDVAVFGEKDFQQLQVIRRMARDLWHEVEIVGAPIVREPDGLAMSSRNVYLSPSEREQALALRRALERARRAFAAGERDAQKLEAEMRIVLDAERGVRVDYAVVVDEETLASVPRLEGRGRALVAAFVGKTRLIDNVALAD